MASGRSFGESCLESFWSAPRVARMRVEGPQGRWAVELRELAKDERAAPLRRVLTDMADVGLQTLKPLGRFLRDDVSGIGAGQFADASALGAEQVRRRPGAAYVITLASVVGWAEALGEKLHGQVNGYPAFGWVDMPYAFARAALQVGDPRGALQVVNLAYDTLMAARYHDHAALLAGISRYRQLAGDAGRRLEQVIDNLADDLLRSGLRTHLLALLWTLGFVPECEALRRSGGLPSRSQVRAVIRLSLERIPEDPLTQFLWLELKDRPVLDLRQHPFFYMINCRYEQYFPDTEWEIMPSQAYARTLIAWLGGTLTTDEMGAYLDLMTPVRAFEKYREHMPGASDWSVYLRMISLAYLLAAEYDMFAEDVTPERRLTIWRSLLDDASQMRGRHHLNPHRADLEGTLNYPMFHVIENLDDPAERVVAMERYRAAAMTFPLAVTTPSALLPSCPDPEREHQLDRERELLRWLRGAQFVVNFPFLPRHFHRYAAYDLQPGEEVGLDIETGRRDYLDVERLLGELYDEMEPTAGEYTACRRDPTARIDTIVNALGQHTQ